MKFYIHKLGCPKNDVDADYITARLIAEGHQPVAKPEEADSILVNTCGFILPAKEESIHELLRLGRLKGSGQVKTIYATGCLSQRHGDELLQGMPELDGAFGLGEFEAIAETVSSIGRPARVIMTEAQKLGYVEWGTRHVSDDLPYTYVKISDGCDRGCGYCAIPYIRGSFRSRPAPSILREAEFLARKGKKELILVSQDATLYGSDLRGGSQTTLVHLLQELDRLENVTWIRIMYLHPAGLTDEIVDYMTSDNKTLPYFDLPLQHINTEILATMRRNIDRPGVETLLGKIRATSAESIIRTTFIVGLPGETQVRFEELVDFVRQFEFDRMGAFCYSPEEGTMAAGMPDQVPAETRYHRLDELMTVQQAVAFAKNNSLIGRIQDVIIDAVHEDGSALGRTYADCPDIDQEVYITGAGLRIGDICPVTITASRGYDLEGTVAEV
jgi:ribosomal protein S12 methylthiotransferase